MHRWLLLLLSFGFCAAAYAQRAPQTDEPRELRAALAAALREAEAAEARSVRFEQQAAAAEDAAERTAQQTAALAARIQQAEAGLIAARARLAMIDRQRALQREQLGREQQPLVELTAALQQVSRRPIALSLLQPGSVKDMVYLRAVLHVRSGQVQADTRGLRQAIDRSNHLRSEAQSAAQALAAEEAALASRRSALAEAETRQRLTARTAGSGADREAERALALAEDARDLDGLVDEFDRAAQLRARLAALPGPQLRPARPQDARTSAGPGPAVTSGAVPPASYILPVSGRTLTGFGAPLDAGTSRGITLRPIGGAQVVAPAAGRVVFAGPYRGYGRIVIIEHPGGWTSLVTGLARSVVAVGQEVVGGAPLGTASPRSPSITLELRRDGEPVNPLPYLR